MGKRILLSVILLLAASVTLRAEIIEGWCGNEGDGYNVTYILDTESGVLTISGDGVIKGDSNSPFRDYEDIIKIAIINDGVTGIGKYTFYNCSNLESVEIPNTVTSIGEYAFYDCSNLQSVDIPNSVNEIRQATFYNCTSLKSVKIPNSVIAIGASAFHGCCNLENLDLDMNEILNIGSGAFAGCVKLEELIVCNGTLIFVPPTYEGDYRVPDNITYIADRAFYGCSGLKSIYIPHTVTNITYQPEYGNAGLIIGCDNLERIDVDPANQYYSSLNGVLFNKKQTKLIYCPAKASVIIPKTIKELKEGVFRDLNIKALTLETLDFPAAFSNSGMTNEPKGIGCLFTTDTTYTDGSTIFPVYKYFYKLPESLKKITIKSDTVCLSDFNTTIHWYYDNGESGWGARIRNTYYYYEANLDTVIIEAKVIRINTKQKQAENGMAYCFDNPKSIKLIYESTLPLEAAVFGGNMTHIELPNIEKLIPGQFANLSKLEELTLPFPGAGTRLATSNFGDLFGTYTNGDMRKVTQVMMDGTQKTYYMPAGLDSLTITEGCEEIPYGCFYNCTMLNKIVLPTTMFAVGEKAFFGCAGMQDIYCKSADPAVAFDNSFDGMRLTSCTLHVPYNTSEMYSISPGWERFYFIEEEAPIVIAAVKNIENAGVIYGLNEYQPGQIAELRAVANSGYTFTAWTENGEIVTTGDTYSFTVTDSRTLTAVFVPVNGDNDIVPSPAGNSVTLQWDAEEGAAKYVAEIFEDEAMTQPVDSVETDTSGRIMTATATGKMSATIGGLSPATQYYYSLTVYADGGIVLSKYTGSFTTTMGGIDSIQNGETMCYGVQGGIKIDGAKNSSIAIFNLQGTTVYSNESATESEFIALPEGLYIVTADGETMKIAVR